MNMGHFRLHQVQIEAFAQEVDIKVVLALREMVGANSVLDLGHGVGFVRLRIPISYT
jgi:hypothetical protein